MILDPVLWPFGLILVSRLLVNYKQIVATHFLNSYLNIS